MPLIEELPTTTTIRASHGWAYVPDTGPTKAILPGNRKRGAARESATNRGDGSAKQAKIVQARLADLEKENYKDTTIPIPTRPKDKGRKITPNVRRILTYQRTFAHYLADEEAQLAAQGGGGSSSTPTVSATLTRTKPARTSTTATPAAAPQTPVHTQRQQLPMHPPPRPQTPRTTATPSNLKREPSSITGLPPDVTPSASASRNQSPPSTTTTSISAALPADPSTDPLLRSTTPLPPSARVMAALLAEPPLSYTAARAQPLPTDNLKPPRHFCAICGYWGKVKCRKCGERICGLMECWRGHEVGCVVGY